MGISRGFAKKGGAVLVLLLLWQILSLQFANGIVVASPLDALRTLWALGRTGVFWRRILNSFTRIGAGFLCSAAAASLSAVLSFHFPACEFLIRPCASLMRSVPVAIVAILLLILFSASGLSAAVVFFLVFPVLYAAFLEGVRAADPKLLEMARVFRWGEGKKWRWIRLPAAWGPLKAAFEVSAGMAWKAGVSAEVIGTPRGSIGEAVYGARIYLATDELFAWCVAILILSWLMERLCFRFLDAAGFLLWGTGA